MNTRFFICSRDRPGTLRRSVDGLSRALRQASLEAQAICCIVDDSTRPECSAEVRSLVHAAGSNGLQLTIIDQARQEDVFERLAGLKPEALRLLRSATRKLGDGPWDLAGARNFAFLLAYCDSAEDDLVVFLDDDIVLTSADYRGRFVEVEGAALLRELLSGTPPGSLVASGAAYLGQFDGSILDHLQMAMEDGGRLAELAAFPSTLPVRLDFADAPPSAFGPGISGALLATTPAALHSHFLPSCYNEDWIWLALLGRPGAAIRKAEAKALHAAPPWSNIESALLTYQSIGEVIYDAVQRAVSGAPCGRTALQTCIDTLSPAHFLCAKESLLGDMRALLDLRTRTGVTGIIARYVEEELVRVSAMDHAALHAWFRRYLADIPVWQNLLDAARERLCPAATSCS